MRTLSIILIIQNLWGLNLFLRHNVFKKQLPTYQFRRPPHFALLWKAFQANILLSLKGLWCKEAYTRLRCKFWNRALISPFHEYSLLSSGFSFEEKTKMKLFISFRVKWWWWFSSRYKIMLPHYLPPQPADQASTCYT